MKIIAMILAAGFGNRLKPITDRVPKPLIKIGRETILEKHLRNLKKANISKVVINVSHLAEKIIKEVGDGSNYGLKIIYSHERKRPLETLGGILNALEFF
ncbi:sugar phosphate nucleotidyltransferase, partial [Pseudomonadota bacterium]|nr:sugar phosphate nucleotidyltransferase [Pseudomonadota bacterium]